MDARRANPSRPEKASEGEVLDGAQITQGTTEGRTPPPAKETSEGGPDIPLSSSKGRKHSLATFRRLQVFRFLGYLASFNESRSAQPFRETPLG